VNNGVRKKESIWEKGPGFKSGLKDLGKNINTKTITAGIIAAIFGCTGPALVVINAATEVGYTKEQIVSWLFGIYVFGGAISIIMALYYKMPIVGAFTIPGASMLATSLVGFTFNEAAFAFIIAGLIVLFLGITGLISKVMNLLPLPIVMGMIVGAMFRFGTGIITSSVSSPLVAGLAVLAFFIVPKFIKKAPPILCSLIVGVVAAIATGAFNGDIGTIGYIPPQIVMPSPNFATVLSVAVPLAALVIGAENAQAVGVLYAQGYKPPINAMTVISGIGGMAAGCVGAHNANIAGPMTAICSSSEAGEDLKGRYAASIVNGICFIIFGLLGSFTMAFISMIPSELVNVLAGLAMINVLLNSLTDAFGSERCRIGAFFALIIAASGISILSIGSAFWALVGGVLISILMERDDFNYYYNMKNL